MTQFRRHNSAFEWILFKRVEVIIENIEAFALIINENVVAMRVFIT